MKISQYNWNCWFILTSLVILIGMMIAMVANTEHDKNVSCIIMILGIVSIIPCLYIGCKPRKD